MTDQKYLAMGLANYSQTTYDPVKGLMIATSVAPDGSSSVSTSLFGRLMSVRLR